MASFPELVGLFPYEFMNLRIHIIKLLYPYKCSRLVARQACIKGNVRVEERRLQIYHFTKGAISEEDRKHS